MLLIMAVASRAWANEATLTIGTPNSALIGPPAYTGPYATVTIDLTSSTTATITVDSLVNGYVYLMGSQNALGLDVNGAVTVSSVTDLNSYAGFTPTYIGSPDQTGKNSLDGFGKFNLVIGNTDGFGDSASQINFTLTLSSGAWSSATNVLTENGDGYYAAVHAYPCATTVSSPCTESEGAATSGYAGDSYAPSLVPEPATTVLFGSGLLLLAGVLRRRVLA